MVPNYFYCTFKEGLGQQAALKMKELVCNTGHKIKIKPARNPSDILWLDYGVKQSSKILRSLIALFFVLVILTVLYFSFTLFVSAKIYINYRAVPPGIVCSSLVDTYSFD